ncbi:MAG TPA: CpaF family protein [Chloroflexi bacterium]|nr:CpaF family protein [Chloroflexota bacterium]
MGTAVEAMSKLLEDEHATEVMVDGPERVYIEMWGKLEETDICFADEQAVVDWANGLLTRHGWPPAGEGRPWAEGRLEDGSRMLVVLPPVAVQGPSVIIRKFLSPEMTFDQLLKYGSIDQTMLDFFRVVMQARLNVVVAGGTASGKTTLTNMLTELMPDGERLIAVERTNELHLRQERVVYLEAEAARAIGGDDVEMSTLLQIASRMRPDRIVVGELVGGEVLEMLRLMNTGHEGILTTIHAKSPRDALARIEKMATMAEPSLTLPAIRAEIAEALDLIVQVNRLEDGVRRVVSIVEVQGLRGDHIQLQDLFTWEKMKVMDDGHRFIGHFRPTHVPPSFAPTLAAAGLVFPEGMFF